MGIDVQRIERRALHAQHHAVEVGDDRVGVEGFAVVEHHALAQVEGPLGAVLAHLPALGQAGDRRGGVVLGHQRFPDIQDLAAIIAVLLAGREIAVARQHDFSIGVGVLRERGRAKQRQRQYQQHGQQAEGEMGVFHGLSFLLVYSKPDPYSGLVACTGSQTSSWDVNWYAFTRLPSG